VNVRGKVKTMNDIKKIVLIANLILMGSFARSMDKAAGDVFIASKRNSSETIKTLVGLRSGAEAREALSKMKKKNKSDSFTRKLFPIIEEEESNYNHRK
jgi:hypothetical protein